MSSRPAANLAVEDKLPVVPEEGDRLATRSRDGASSGAGGTGPRPSPARTEPADPPPAAADSEHDPGPGTDGQAGRDGAATYVFGITRTTVALDPDLPRVPGGRPVRAVDHGDLRAVVCDAHPDALRALEDLGPDDLDRLATVANAHDQVLARVAAQAPVLPLRLGTLLGDDPTVRALLAANADVLERELARVEGPTPSGPSSFV